MTNPLFDTIQKKKMIEKMQANPEMKKKMEQKIQEMKEKMKQKKEGTKEHKHNN